MKENLLIPKVIVAMAVLFVGPLASAGGLSGNYQVIQSDCDTTGILYAGNQNAVVQADASGIRVGQNFDSGFEAAFAFRVGTQKVHALGDGYELYEGSYSPDATQFKDVEMYAGNDGSTPVYDGEVDFKLAGDMLEIDVTADGQPQPAPLTVCLLKRLQ